MLGDIEDDTTDVKKKKKNFTNRPDYVFKSKHAKMSINGREGFVLDYN